jgi:hypothetical protein
MIREFVENFFRQAPGLMFELASAAIILLFGGYFAQTIGAAADDFLARAKIMRAAGKSKLLKAAIKKKIAGKALKFWILIVFAMMSAKIVGLESLAGVLGRIALAGVCLFAAVFVYFAAVIATNLWRSKSFRAKITAGKFADKIKKKAKCLKETFKSLSI